MSQPSLVARTRESKGKGAARKLRKNNQVPAVFYGPNSAPVMLAVDSPDLERVLRDATSENVILNLQIKSDGKTSSKQVILKELQADPMKPVYYHADFFEIAMDKELTVNVPIHLANTPVGVVNGGVLQHVRRELAISCLPDKMIDSIEVDVSGLDIGDALHVEDIKLPEGITNLEEGALTVAVVAAPSVAREEVEEEEEVEGEAVEPVEESAE